MSELTEQQIERGLKEDDDAFMALKSGRIASLQKFVDRRRARIEAKSNDPQLLSVPLTRDEVASIIFRNAEGRLATHVVWEMADAIHRHIQIEKLKKENH
jgi:hypothetical protein